MIFIVTCNKNVDI